MRVFRTILVVALLILFPALSWFYLQTGKDWRMSGVAEIAEKTPLFPRLVQSTEGDTIMPADLLGNYIIATDLQYPVHEEVLAALHDQFGEREDMILLAMSPGGYAPEGWLGIECTNRQCDWLRRYLSASQNSALIDDSLRMRHTYDLTKGDDQKKLVEHTALLVPLEKRERLELRRDQ